MWDESLAAAQPVGRFGTADDVATPAPFLVAPASDDLTGEIVVDGGNLLMQGEDDRVPRADPGNPGDPGGLESIDAGNDREEYRAPREREGPSRKAGLRADPAAVIGNVARELDRESPLALG